MKVRLGRWRYPLIALAIVSVALSLINASWIAPRPPGRLTLVSAGGVGQSYDRAAAAPCAAARIAPSEENVYIEGTLPALYKALKLGAQSIALPVRRTRDGQAVIFPDAALDCRTNGDGAVAAHSLAELKAIDAGHGYTPDGTSFPLRGRGVGAIPTVEQVLHYLPTADLIFEIDSGDAADAEALAAALRRSGIALDARYGFVADGAAAERLRRLLPGAWVFGPDSGAACLRDYLAIGWSGIVPASCRGTSLVLPIGERWKIWGWPYRFFDRMAGAGSRIVIVGAVRRGRMVGLERPEQYDRVPADFHGHLLVEDIWNMGPALRR